MNIPFIDLSAQQQPIRARLEKRIQNVLDHGRYIMGPEVAELEERLADYVGIEHCIGVSSGTDALLIAMMALGIGPGDEVITTPFTFIATGEMIALLGAKLVFVDIDARTYNLNPELIENRITNKTRAILAVDLYGQCAEYDRLNQIAERHGIAVIEDGAQSFGASYKDRKACSLAMIGCTSFFPSKPLGCYGDGGACFTNDEALAKRMRQIRTHGQDRRYHHPVVGLNGRLDTLQAAILLEKFELFPEEVKARELIGNRYTAGLESAVTTPHIEPYNRSVYAQYTIQVENRDHLQAALKERGIPTAVHYPIPLTRQPALKQFDAPAPEADRAAAHVISLPISPWLSERDQDFIITSILELSAE